MSIRRKKKTLKEISGGCMTRWTVTDSRWDFRSSHICARKKHRFGKHECSCGERG